MPPSQRPSVRADRSTRRSISSRRATGASRPWKPRPQEIARARPGELDRPSVGCPHVDDQARGQGDPPGRSVEPPAAEDREPHGARHPARSAVRAADRRRLREEARGRSGRSGRSGLRAAARRARAVSSLPASQLDGCRSPQDIECASREPDVLSPQNLGFDRIDAMFSRSHRSVKFLAGVDGAKAARNGMVCQSSATMPLSIRPTSRLREQRWRPRFPFPRSSARTR
jgi:hypothetical protein